MDGCLVLFCAGKEQSIRLLHRYSRTGAALFAEFSAAKKGAFRLPFLHSHNDFFVFPRESNRLYGVAGRQKHRSGRIPSV